MNDIYNEIRKAMFKNVDELYRNRKKIRKEYQNLEEYAKKEVYKWWFFFYLCHLKNPLKELLWDYLNNLTVEEMTKIYNIVLEAQQAALDAAKAGITGSQLDFAARNIIEDYGYGDCFGHSLGHGVGMEIHEFPNASPKSTAVLKPNEIITIEPLIYIPEKFGVRIEDFVILTENSCENMTKCAKNIISL